MATQHTDAPNPDHPYQPADDEIDLGRYVEILFSWWREILLITLGIALVSVIAGYLYSQSLPVRYRATATAVIARVFSEVTFDERFQTLSDGDKTSSTGNSWRSSLLGLARNGAIAQAVIEELGDILTDQEQTAADLLEAVDSNLAPSVDTKTQSNLIQISATADDPDKAAAIANAWIVHYIDQVNRVYGRVPDEVVDAVSAELETSSDVYQRAQLALESFIADNAIATRNRQIEEKQTLLDELQSSREAGVGAVVLLDRETRLNTFQSLADAQNDAASAVLDQQLQEQLQSISRAYAAQAQANHFLDQAGLLEQQIKNGGNPASNELAIQLLKTQVFASAISTQNDLTPIVVSDGEVDGLIEPAVPMLPGNLQFNVNPLPATETSAADQLADITALVTALQQFATDQEERIDALSQALLDGTGIQYLDQIDSENLTVASGDLDSIDQAFSEAILRNYDNLFSVGELVQRSQIQGGPDDTNDLSLTIDQLDQEIQALKSQLEAETARELRLTQQRDLAWNTYDTLSNKVIELNLERTAANSEVRMGAPAIPPSQPLPGPDLKLVVVGATVIGFMLALAIALVASILGVQPPLSRRRTATT